DEPSNQMISHLEQEAEHQDMLMDDDDDCQSLSISVSTEDTPTLEWDSTDVAVFFHQDENDNEDMQSKPIPSANASFFHQKSFNLSSSFASQKDNSTASY